MLTFGWLWRGRTGLRDASGFIDSRSGMESPHHVPTLSPRFPDCYRSEEDDLLSSLTLSQQHRRGERWQASEKINERD